MFRGAGEQRQLAALKNLGIALPKALEIIGEGSDAKANAKFAEMMRQVLAEVKAQTARRVEKANNSWQFIFPLADRTPGECDTKD